MSPLRKLFKRAATAVGPALLLAFFLSPGSAWAQEFDQATYDAGAKLFKANCGACHKPDKKMTGPALKGVREQWEGQGDIYEWIKDSQAYIKSGNAFAQKLFEEWNRIPMPPQPLSHEEIDQVLYYSDMFPGPAAGGAKAPTAPVETAPANTTHWWVILGLVLVVVLLSLRGVRDQLVNEARKREGLEPEPKLNTWGRIRRWASRHKGWASAVALLFVVWLVVLLWNWMFNIGVYGGEKNAHYKPSQPILYDHSLHAGDLAIECQYCHSGASKSRHAGIPSANVCMNCHKAVDSGPKTGTEEIAKIYAAVGWDPEKGEYTGEEHPIKWNKVHNLPDHVYFNHEQHVRVGKLECQECHGPVEKVMDQAEQWSPLTMRWCLDCHNEREVALSNTDNGYYQEIHRRLTETPTGREQLKKYLEDEKVTVRELGGWECAKCHY